MVTSQGFNALLKIVEEPPEHVKFIFATTEPEKVISAPSARAPTTIRSAWCRPRRCSTTCSSSARPRASRSQPGVLPLVVRAGGGSVRDTLSLLDQLIAGSEGHTTIDYERAVALLGYTHGALLDEVVDAIGARDAAGGVRRRRPRRADRPRSASLRRRPARAPARPHRRRGHARRRRVGAARRARKTSSTAWRRRPPPSARPSCRARRRRQHRAHRDDRRDLAAAAPRAHGRAAARAGVPTTPSAARSPASSGSSAASAVASAQRACGHARRRSSHRVARCRPPRLPVVEHRRRACRGALAPVERAPARTETRFPPVVE